MKKDMSNYSTSNHNFESLMSCHPSNASNFSYLMLLMRRNVVIPFLGAGFSANFGYPGWGKFLRIQAQKYNLPDVIEALEKRQYEKAASALREELGGNLEYTLMQVFGDHIYKSSPRVREIEELPRVFHSLILTTNFDEVIEMLYAKVNHEYIEKLTPKSLKDVEISHKRIACGEPTLIKLHGDVAAREFVLTEQEYNEVYGKRILDTRLPLPEFLRDILLSRVILFLGCSLEDDRTLQVIEQSQINGSISFALVPLPESTKNKEDPWNPQLTCLLDGASKEKPDLQKRRQFLNTHNIIPIWYPNGEYEALRILLKEIARQISFDGRPSATVARDKLDQLLSDAIKRESNGDTAQAFYCYSNAVDLLKGNLDVFSDKEQLDILEKARSFYNSNGYAFDSIEIVKDIIALIKRLYTDDSIALARCYHDIGFTYERYGYYKLLLKAMKKSFNILGKCKEELGETEPFHNTEALLYMSLAYAYSLNNDDSSALIWYQKANKVLQAHGDSLDKGKKAYIYNGLHRYYRLLKDHDAALNALETALKLRWEIYRESTSINDLKDALMHIINTYSNKIDVFIQSEQYTCAREAFEECRRECSIWERPEYLRDSKSRILTDHGDILRKEGRFAEACNEYKKALSYRKYLHFVDDFLAAKTYLKIADSLASISDDQGYIEEAMEYYIHSYVIYERMLGEHHPNVQQIWNNMIMLGMPLSYGESKLMRRIAAQKDLLQYRYDERMDDLESRLISDFEL